MKNYGSNKNKMSKKNFYFVIFFIVLTAVAVILISLNRGLKSSNISNSNSDSGSEMSLPNSAETHSLKNDVKKNLNENELIENDEINFDEHSLKNKTNEKSKNNVDLKTEKKNKLENKPKIKTLSNKFLKPVDGEVLQNFSNNELVLSETLGDFRTHNGVDLKALTLTPVKAVADGVVVNVENDAGRWGTCVEIKHDDDLVSVYRGLNENLNVKIDSKIKAGEIIGTVGDSNMFEGALEPHLHFEIKKGEEFLNPLDYLK